MGGPMKKKTGISRAPIKLLPEPVERVWGGNGVQRIFGWVPPGKERIGEWWILSFRHDHPSIIGEGDFKGIPLPQLVYAHPELVGGKKEPALLVKIIDSADRLSIQVHPDDPLAQRMKLDSGKTECWYFLDSAPGAVIYCGLKENVDVDDFFTQASQNPLPHEIEKYVRAVAVRKGDFAFIGAGTVHAIGEGVVLMEVQQNSDTTFRIYDWGRPRELHLMEARQAVLQAHPEPYDSSGSAGSDVLLSCKKFTLKGLSFAKKGLLSPQDSNYIGLTCLEGEGEIQCDRYQSCFKSGDTYFIPAGHPRLKFESTGDVYFMLSYPPLER